MGGHKKDKSKKNHPEKEKIPQRGMGVARLEKLRLEEKMRLEQLVMASRHYVPPSTKLTLHTPSVHQEQNLRMMTVYPSIPPPPPTYHLNPSIAERVEVGFNPNAYSESQSRFPIGWNQCAAERSLTKHSLNLDMEAYARSKRNKSNFVGMSSVHAGTSRREEQDEEELDLELKL